ncbi:MAG: BrnT family toxin [Lentisphaeria bacterium]|nr:BrnT family toxin [Lentisphaeria bacterium]
MTFEWDLHKAASNAQKHGVIFEEAATVFEDEEALVIYDTEHSQAEDRFVILGMSSSLRLLVVCHCYRSAEEVIRIVSARKATTKESHQYLQRKRS